MAATYQIEVADRRLHGDRQGFALFGRRLLQVSFHVHAIYFTKKIKQTQV